MREPHHNCPLLPNQFPKKAMRRVLKWAINLILSLHGYIDAVHVNELPIYSNSAWYILLL